MAQTRRITSARSQKKRFPAGLDVASSGAFGPVEPMRTNGQEGNKPTDSSTEHNSNNPNAVPDEQFIDAVEELAADDQTDIGGGVPPAAIADAVDCAESTARQRLPSLVDNGALVQEWGLMPIGSSPRRSYLPRGDD